MQFQNAEPNRNVIYNVFVEISLKKPKEKPVVFASWPATDLYCTSLGWWKWISTIVTKPKQQQQQHPPRSTRHEGMCFVMHAFPIPSTDIRKKRVHTFRTVSTNATKKGNCCTRHDVVLFRIIMQTRFIVLWETIDRLQYNNIWHDFHYLCFVVRTWQPTVLHRQPCFVFVFFREWQKNLVIINENLLSI